MKGVGLVRKNTKSTAGERTLPLPSIAVAMLRRRKLASGKPAGLPRLDRRLARSVQHEQRPVQRPGLGGVRWVISRSSEPSTVKHEDDHKTLVLTPRKSRATACQRRDDPILLEVLMRHCI
jgi:hypothetical protein